MYIDYRERPRKRRGCCLSQIVISFYFITVIAASFYYYFDTRPIPVISPIPEEYKPTNYSILNFLKPQKNSEDLKTNIQKRIGNEWHDYSVYVVDLNSSFRMGINESTVYTGASINKVPIFAALYAEANKGTVNFDKVVTLQEEDIQDYGTGSIRYDPPGTKYSVKTLGRLMMQKSDNTAAHLLAVNIIGLNKIQQYVNSWGMTQTDMTNNKTSNRDMFILFQKIMNKEFTTPVLSDEMLGFLKDSDFEDRLPALLPIDAIVYHKIGTGTGTVHDVGIVTSGKTAYYIGIFTNDIQDEEQAASLVALISRLVFDYMVR